MMKQRMVMMNTKVCVARYQYDDEQSPMTLANNHLFGIIPPEFSSLIHLSKLQLNGNNLHGLISGSFLYLSNLTLLTLMDNHLTGTIPPSLQYVNLSGNILNGKIPAEIGHCPKLWNLNYN
ncbi:hypothetical protein LguiA_028473 [Lonicera macranthoides]